MKEIFAYCVARAAEKYGVEVHAACAMSNHYHLVLTDPRGVVPDFVAWLNRHLAMCIKRFRKWDEVVWEPNVQYSAVELIGPAEVLDKVAYVILNPVRAELVPTPEDWPGLLSVLGCLREGGLVTKRPGVWFKEHAPSTAVLRYTTPPVFTDESEYLTALERILAERLSTIEQGMRRRRRRWAGRKRVLGLHVSDRPSTSKQKSGQTPTFSALTRLRWIAAAKHLREFRSAYRTAYEAWRAGRRDTEFPRGTWWMVKRAGAAAAP